MLRCNAFNPRSQLLRCVQQVPIDRSPLLCTSRSRTCCSKGGKPVSLKRHGPHAFGEDRVVPAIQAIITPCHSSDLGDDAAARDRAIDALIHRVVDPSWSSLNLSRLDGADPDKRSRLWTKPAHLPSLQETGAAATQSVLQWRPVTWPTDLRPPSR